MKRNQSDSQVARSLYAKAYEQENIIRQVSWLLAALRHLSGLPALSYTPRAVTMFNDKHSTSYSSATAPDLHQLPYSVDLMEHRPPDEKEK